MFKNYKEFITEVNITPFSIKNLEAIEDMLISLDTNNIDLAEQLFNQRKDIKGSKGVNEKINDINRLIVFMEHHKRYVDMLQQREVNLTGKFLVSDIDIVFKLINKNSRKLLLDKNSLTYIPKEIGRLTKLEHLYLGHNHITELPKEIGLLTNLKTLQLYGNQLTTLPKEIGGLTNLEYLYLIENQLTTLPKEIGKLTNLETLALNYNNLTTLPKEIGKLKKLDALKVKGNKLKSVPKEIGNLVNLYTIDLSYNELTTLPKEISKLVNLGQIDFKNYSFTGEQEKIIQSYLPDLHIKF